MYDFLYIECTKTTICTYFSLAAKVQQKKAAGIILPPNFHYTRTHKTALRAKQQKVRTT